MKFPSPPNIYALSDSGFDHIGYFREVIKAGVDIIQLRDKNLCDRRFYNIALKLRELTAKYKKLFIVNDRVDVCLAVEADGVHLGEDDLPLSVARKVLGDSKIIGYSAHSFKSALYAWRQGADYISVGPIFRSGTKKYLAPIPVTEIQLIIQKIKLPLVAIGGINIKNIVEVKELGFKNVALISGLKNAKHRKKMLTTMRTILEK